MGGGGGGGARTRAERRLGAFHLWLRERHEAHVFLNAFL